MAVDFKKIKRKLHEHFASMSEEDKQKIRDDYAANRPPKGWVSIETHLPMWMAEDFIQGYTEYRIKYEDGTEGKTGVSDHNVWYYEAKEAGVTHWYNE